MQGFAQARVGQEAAGVVQVEPADLAVGPGAQFQGCDDAAELVEAGVWWFHAFILVIGHPGRQ